MWYNSDNKISAPATLAMSWSVSSKGELSMKRNRTTVQCARCGASFQVKASKLKHGRGKFCSMSCKRQSQRLVRRPLDERFWEKVVTSPDSCWLWTGAQSPRGYGAFVVSRGDVRTASRVSWELVNGPIPDGLWVLHRCDNPPCVNPDHLFLGTHQDNMDDMAQKGRGRKPREAQTNTLGPIPVIAVDLKVEP